VHETPASALNTEKVQQMPHDTSSILTCVLSFMHIVSRAAQHHQQQAAAEAVAAEASATGDAESVMDSQVRNP
jgi:hypothetical protein